MMLKAAELFVEIGANIDGLTSGIDKGQSALTAFAGNAFKTGATLSGAITAPTILAGKAIFDLGARFEQAEVAFSTMLGSGERAARFLKDLESFAQRTPFQFTELQDASRRLLAFGFAAEEVLPMLTDIGDAVAGLGLGAAGVDRVTLALGQMKAKTKVSGQEMMQLTEAGIPAWKYLADSMGISTAEVMKLTERGLVPADEAIQAILRGARQDFGGLMAKQSETAAGQLSNLQDSLEALGRDMAQVLLPTAKDLIAEAQSAVQWFGGLSDETKELILGTGALAAAAGPAMIGFSAMASGAQVLMGAFRGLAVVPGIVQGIRTAFNSWNSYISLTGALTTQFGAMAVTLSSVALAVGSVAAVWYTWNEQITKTQKEGLAENVNAWAGAMQKAAENGKTTTAILDEYAAAIQRVNQAHDESGLIADLFVNKQEIINNGLRETLNVLPQTARDWEEYNVAARAAAELAGYQVDEQGRLFKVVREANRVTKQYADDVSLLTKEQYGLQYAFKQTSPSMEEIFKLQQQLTSGAGELQKATLGTKDILSMTGASLKQFGMDAEAARLVTDGLAVTLGDVSPQMRQLQTDTQLVSDAFALGIVGQDEFTAAMQRAKEGTLALDEARRGELQTAVNGAIATRENAQAAAEAAREYWGLAESLKGASEAQFAKQMLGQLGELLKSDTPNVALYNQAYQDLALSYGFATEGSMALAGALPQLFEILEQGKIAPEQMSEAMGYLYKDAQDGAVNWETFAQKFNITEPFGTTQTALEETGAAVMTFGEDATKTTSVIETEFPKWVQSAQNTAESISKAFTGENWVGVGLAISDGVATGILQGASKVADAARQAAKAAYRAATDELGIHSPSTKFRYLGEMAVKGFEMPFIESNYQPVRESLASSATATIAPPTTQYSGGGVVELSDATIRAVARALAFEIAAAGVGQ